MLTAASSPVSSISPSVSRKLSRPLGQFATNPRPYSEPPFCPSNALGKGEEKKSPSSLHEKEGFRRAPTPSSPHSFIAAIHTTCLQVCFSRPSFSKQDQGPNRGPPPWGQNECPTSGLSPLQSFFIYDHNPRV